MQELPPPHMAAKMREAVCHMAGLAMLPQPASADALGAQTASRTTRHAHEHDMNMT